MHRQELVQQLIQLRDQEVNRADVQIHARRRVALVYPNTYFVGMSNLGLQIIYEELNAESDTVAERIFLPEPKEISAYEKTKTKLMSIESQRSMQDFMVLGFDMTFEMDYFHVPQMLRLGGVQLWAAERTERDPYVIGGGPCCTFNPEPLADFFDAFIIGEGEGTVARVVATIGDGQDEGLSREEILWQLSRIPGVYVPSLYEPQYDESGRFAGFVKAPQAPATIERQWGPLTRAGETVVATEYTEFGAMYIIEVARGCGRHCRFCMAGYCYRTPRVRPLEILKEGVDRACAFGKKIGLMGAAISDYPEIDELVQYIQSKGLRYSCASLRADSLTQDVVDGLAASGQKTITIAPEAGSERLRRVINKGIDEADVEKAVYMAAKAGIQHMRFYIMVGLPTETQEDIDEIIGLARRTLAHMTKAGSKGRLTLSVNPFIPKPFTPFQWMPMAHQKEITKKLDYIKKALRQERRIEVLVESPKEAYMQGVLARGDRRLGRILYACDLDRGSKSFVSVCKDLGFDREQALYEPAREGEPLPWMLLDMHLREGYLETEWQRGLEENYTMHCQEGCKRCGVCR